MPWTEVGPGLFERPLDITDTFMKTLCLSTIAQGREHWVVNVIAAVQWATEIAPAEIVNLLERAWIQTRYHHPSIATILEDDKFIYQVPNDTALTSWLAATVFVEEDTIDAFLARTGIRTYCSLHYFPASAEILLRAHHWIVDGRGSLNLLHRFLELLSNDLPLPRFGDEAARLTPALTEAAGFSLQPTLEAQEEGQKLFIGFTENLPSIGLPCKTDKLVCRSMKRGLRRFGPSTLKALIEACKKREVSITSAVHAAINVAVQEMKSELVAAKSYASVAPYDYRPYLPAPYNDAEAWPIGCYTLGLYIARPRADFATHASEYHRKYNQPLSRGVFPHFESYNAYLSLMAAALTRAPLPGSPLTNQPQLSGIGVVDQRVRTAYLGKQHLLVSHVEIVADIMAPGILVYQWSWRENFFMSINYNDAFVQDELAQDFLSQTCQILFTELGIEVESNSIFP